MQNKLDKYLAEKRKKSGDLRLASEPLSANEYEDALISICKNKNVPDEDIIRAIEEYRLQDLAVSVNTNDDSVAKLGVAPNCKLEDIQRLGVETTYWGIDSDGEPLNYIDHTDSDFYEVQFNCSNCNDYFDSFKEVKEHING